MMCGVIDIGSNSVLLVVGEENRILLDEDRVTRLGEGLNHSKRLKMEAMIRTSQVVCEFKNTARKIGAQKVIAVGTMALRMAENAPEFLELVKERCSLDVRILSGEEEAILSFRGAYHSLNLKGRVAVADIGGRSTEVATGDGEKIEFIRSFNIGALTLLEHFLHTDTLEIMIDYSMKTFSSAEIRSDHLAGIGGTITNLAAIKLRMETYNPDRVHGLILTYGEIYEIASKLASMTQLERKKVKGLQPRRVDTIVPGSAIVLGLMKALGFDRIVVSDRGLRHALLKDCSSEHF